MGFPGIAVGLVLTQLVLAAVGLWYIRDVFAWPLPPVYPIGELLWESLPYYIGNYLSYLRGDGDNLLVTALLGPTALAEYYVAKTLYTNVCCCRPLSTRSLCNGWRNLQTARPSWPR
jgi:O-antigen/teichoic acid export membrane protein